MTANPEDYETEEKQGDDYCAGHDISGNIGCTACVVSFFALIAWIAWLVCK